MITFHSKGDWSKTSLFFDRALEFCKLSGLDKYGKAGVEALRKATPVDTGKTADSWEYEIQHSDTGATIIWKNTNVNDGANIALLLQYGHGTVSGSYVQGIDYINPALQPIFDEIVESATKEMNNA